MARDREPKLRNEIFLLEDVILYAKSKGEKDLDSEEQLLKKVRRYFEQGTWSMAERELLRAEWLRNSKWYMELIKKREEEGIVDAQNGEVRRFIGDGLCKKYGHIQVKIRMSNVRWYYQCRLCGKRKRSQSIK
jgi:hypothetical protein